jgi:hypothetical protein
MRARPWWQAEAAGKAVAAFDGLLEASSKPVCAPMTLTSAAGLQSCLITPPSAVTCPWVATSAADENAELLQDRIYVHYAGDMDNANMQLSLFSSDGMEFSQAPPAATGSQPYWSVCAIEAGRVCPIKSRFPVSSQAVGSETVKQCKSDA